MSDEKKIFPWLKLKDNHPTMIKLAKLYDLAEELGIHIIFDHNATIVHDNQLAKDHPSLRLEDVDSCEHISEWPPTFEYKVIFQNPEHIAKEKAIRDEWQKNREKELAEAEIKRKAKEKAEKAAEARELEIRERNELSRLKEKFKE